MPCLDPPPCTYLAPHWGHSGLLFFACVGHSPPPLGALHGWLLGAQEMCIDLGMETNVIIDGSWWTEPWVPARVECDYDHTLIDDPSA